MRPKGSDNLTSPMSAPRPDFVQPSLGSSETSAEDTDARAAERERAEVELTLIKHGEDRFRRYFELGLIGMAITSPTKCILEVNDELCSILGYTRDELLRKNWAEITHPEDLANDVVQFDQVLAGEKDEYTMDKRWIRQDGQIVYSIMSAKCVRRADGSVDYFVGLVQDITQRKQAEEELHKTQAELAHVSRVTTVGELTASIAHEVNQPLGAIVTNGHACLRLLSRDNPDIEEARQAVECIIADGMRAGEVIKRIRRLLKKSTTGKSSHNINSIIRDVLGLTGGELSKNGIKVRTQLAGGLPQVIVDRVQIQQVVLNLILNGKEAMSRAGWQPRELLIKTEQTGPEIIVKLADTGIGISSDSREQAFEPFFTSKEGGLGLGLSISRTIIYAHGGRLWLEPGRNEQGTIAQFALPTGEDSHERENPDSAGIRDR